MRDVVGTRNVDERFAGFATRDGRLSLMRAQFEGAPELNALGLSPLPSLASPGLDQLALELSQAAEHRQHQPAMWRRGVGPGVGHALEARASLADRVEDVQQIARRARQAIEPGDDQHIALLETLEDLRKLGAVGLRTAHLLAVDLGATSGMERGILGRQGLAVGADAGIAVNGHFALNL